MDAALVLIYSFLGTLVLLIVAPFVRGRIWAILWLWMGASGGLVLPDVTPVHGRSLVPLVVQFVAAALVGGIALVRPNSMVRVIALVVVASTGGWNVGLVYSGDRLVAALSAIVLTAWVVGWRQKLLTPPS